MISEAEVVIVGGGAAGIAAGRRLHDAGVDCLLIEARSRLGGRAWTVRAGGDLSLDLGCGWLHSADRNPWTKIAAAQGLAIDKTPPPWSRPAMPIGFPLAEQASFLQALQEFRERLDSASEAVPDVAAESFLAPGGRWNDLINAVGTYVSGAELDRVSALDHGRYEDTGVNWRVVEGYGTAITAHAAGVPVVLGAPVQHIDHSGRRLRVETVDGTIAADAAIVTVPTNVLAEEGLRFTPGLPGKIEAAAGLPLGLADKLFLSLSDADEFEKDARLFGRPDCSGTATYHMRPFGRPLIEVYFAGSLAEQLEAEGDDAFFAFASEELVALIGNDFARRIKPLHIHRWRADPFARGSYSYALPGKAECRAVLAAPVDDRLFFAGEACSRNDYSTAHGGYLTGVAAAEQVIAVRRSLS
ncbi:MAG TPA: NAD(P)/FAD-dependent oxidoreductase [Xanthobacteraceae bacterium]|jgi:monoamine oxidase|nr:NAD(P)/FAD-dependent oxidoreductase [Xanthobacteraceae bacterium]